MMKKILFCITFGFLFSIVSAQYNKNLFDQENVYVYDLKNLESDLKKNYTDYQCAITQEDGVARKCTTYKMKLAPDQAIRSYIYFLKTRQLQKAANIANTKLGKAYQYPFMISNTTIFNSYMIPFHEGLLGFDDFSQAGILKFSYITVKGSKLYKFRSNTSFALGTTEGSVDNVSKKQTTNLIVYGSGMQKLGTLEIKIPYSVLESNDGVGSYSVDQNWHKNYLLKKLKSTDLDLWTNAFKTKIKKLFR